MRDAYNIILACDSEQPRHDMKMTIKVWNNIYESRMYNPSTCICTRHLIYTVTLESQTKHPTSPKHYMNQCEVSNQGMRC